MFIKKTVTAVLVLTFIASIPGGSQVSYANDESAAVTETSTSAEPKPLEGRVEIGVTLNDLRDARLSISRARKATANLYDEMNRQAVEMSFTPNFVGTTIITTPTPRFTGQFLPPRKKWVDASMAEIGPIIKLFKEDVDLAIESNRRTDVSEKTGETLTPIREEAFELVKSSFEVYKNLESMTVGPAYDARSISSSITKLDDHMKQLDKTLKKGMSILTKEAKALKKRKSAAT